MSCIGIWRPKETLDVFKPIGANGCLRGRFQWKHRVFKAGVVVEYFLKKKGHGYCYLRLIVEGESVGFFKCDNKVPRVLGMDWVKTMSVEWPVDSLPKVFWVKMWH